MIPSPFAALALILALASGASAQERAPLGLREAIERARTGSYANRIAQARADAEATQKVAALRGILPTLRIESGYLRTTDPIGVFGTTLRQRRITVADFDPARLNYPDAVNNYSGALVVEAPLINMDAYTGRAAAGRAADAAYDAAAWSAIGTTVSVIRAYFGAVLAVEKTRTLEAALGAAQAHVRQAEQMVKAGLATLSDALLAGVKEGEVETQLLEAAGEVDIARRRLGILQGGSGDFHAGLPEQLPAAKSVYALLALTVADSLAADRKDVGAARHAADAARLDVTRAKALYLPRLNAVARYDWNSSGGPFGGDRNWTVGLMASWTPFAGASEIAERQAASARSAAAEAGLAAAQAQARLDIKQANVERDVAIRRLQLAERGAQQSAEAHRIVARKYEGGLATIVELLQASAGSTQAQLALAYARYQGITAAADHLRAYGIDPAIIAGHLVNETVGERP